VCIEVFISCGNLDSGIVLSPEKNNKHFLDVGGDREEECYIRIVEIEFYWIKVIKSY